MNEPRPLTDSDEHRRLRWFVYSLLITLAAGLGASSICRVEPLLSANDKSRWATVRALVDYDTWQIDEVIVEDGWDTIDKVRHEEHFYSSKPPLLSWLVSWVYRGVNTFSDQLDGEPDPKNKRDSAAGWNFAEKPAETARAILIIVNLLPWLCALVVFAATVERYAERDWTKVFLVAAASLGTILSTYLVTLNNHLTAVVSVILAIAPAMRIVIDGERKWWLFAVAGFFAAFTCTNELPAALFGVLMFGLLVWKAPKETLVFFVPAALVPLGAFFALNYEVTGGIKPFYAYYGTEKYEYVHNGVPSYWMNPGGIDANEEPPWLYFVHCTIGHRGIFSLTPIFLLSVIGWIGLRRWKNARLQPFLWMGLGLTVAIIGFYLTRTANYNYGGNSAGLRWTFWLTPFWLIAMIPVFDAFSASRLFRGTSIVLLAVSVFSATYSLSNPWRPPWLAEMMQRWKWIDYRSPRPESPYDHRIVTWFPSLPKPGEWILFHGFDTEGYRLELELRGGDVTKQNGKTVQRLEVHWTREGKPTRTGKYDIDVAAFNAGKVPQQFLIATSEDSEYDAFTFFAGFPHPQRREYSIGREVYPFVPVLRTDAFACRESAARVGVTFGKGTPQERRIVYRVDALLTDDVPFGVIEVHYTTRDGETDDLLSSLTLKAVAASRVKKVILKVPLGGPVPACGVRAEVVWRREIPSAVPAR